VRGTQEVQIFTETVINGETTIEIDEYIISDSEPILFEKEYISEGSNESTDNAYTNVKLQAGTYDIKEDIEDVEIEISGTNGDVSAAPINNVTASHFLQAVTNFFTYVFSFFKAA